MTTRVLAPDSGHYVIGVNGCGFSALPGTTHDVPDCYAPCFVAKGWTVVCHMGPDDGLPWPRPGLR